ncbi:hypothetical protein OH77DRAFT_1359447, partial [Trametes cingulata]
QCASQCLSQAGSTQGCSDISNLSCVCTSATFIAAVSTCVAQSCPIGDIQAALAHYQEECAGFQASGEPAHP